MKKGLSILTCAVLLTHSAHAASLSKRQRWLMRFAGIGLVGVGLLAQSQANDYDSKASDVMSNFNASHSPGGANYTRDQFNAVAQQSAYQKDSNAWDIGKSASWGAAGLLITASFIPDAWIGPADNHDGVIVGRRWHFGLPHAN